MADRKVHRGMRDEAGVGPNPRDARRLVPMRDLRNYKVVDGEPDIRGWSVYTATGRELGDVEDLLVDTDLGEVVMVDVDLKRDDRHTLAPIKAAWIDREHRRVVLNTSMFDVDDAIPALNRRAESIESESVRRFNERYERAYGEDGWDRDRDIAIRHATTCASPARRRLRRVSRAIGSSTWILAVPRQRAPRTPSRAMPRTFATSSSRSVDVSFAMGPRATT